MISLNLLTSKYLYTNIQIIVSAKSYPGKKLIVGQLFATQIGRRKNSIKEYRNLNDINPSSVVKCSHNWVQLDLSSINIQQGKMSTVSRILMSGDDPAVKSKSWV